MWPRIAELRRRPDHRVRRDDTQIVCIRFRLVSAGDGGISTGDLST